MSLTNSTIIEIRNLSFSYNEKSNAVFSDFNLSVEKGETLFIFGPSGSGKSTFLELISGVLNCQAGQISILGKSVEKMSASARDQFRADHIGYVFQSFNLIPYLTVFENIEMSLLFSAKRKEKLKRTVSEEIKFLAGRLGIENLLGRKATALSVGQQQRVAVARALLGAPEILLADEPTSALDFDHRGKFIKLLFEVAKEMGTTVLFVSHDRSLDNLFGRKLPLISKSRGSE